MLDTYMNALDLSILSIYRINGQELPRLPGLLAQNPPKKTARGREQDRLLVYLTLAGNVNFSDNEYDQIVNQVAETFYDTPGSLTFALKTAASALNTYLVERNMKSTGKGLYSMGALVLCNLRGNSLYIVQSGPTHVYHLNNETRHLFDPLLAGKGLGLSQNARMYFSQVTLSAGDRLLMCVALPPTWDKSITEIRGSAPLETTRRRLLATTDGNVSALLVKASEGSGVTAVIGPTKESSLEPARPAVQEVKPAAEQAVAVEKAPPAEQPPIESPVMPQTQVEPVEANLQIEAQPVPAPAVPAQPEPGPSLLPDSSPSVSENHTNPPSPVYQGPQVFRKPVDRSSLLLKLQPAARSLAQVIQKTRAGGRKFIDWSEKAIPRLLPGNEEKGPATLFSRSSATFLAIALPLTLFVVARIVYYQFGFAAQYGIYYNRAEDAAQQALTASSPAALRVEWQAALDWLDKADQYQDPPSPASVTLRKQAQTALDSLNKVVRTNFFPAFSAPLGRNLQITRMVANESDIYLLDSLRGNVVRGIYTGKNYELDTTFECGPGNYSGIRVDKLIDILTLPRSKEYDATLMGIDVSGNLLYCAPGEQPKAAFLQIPDTGWKGITAIYFDNYSLYVLDAPARAVWVYHGSDKLEFTDKPFFFFEQQVPVMLEQAIDLAVNNDDLYLLHQDGHLTTCTRSNIDTSSTRCNDPALYVDTRPGYQGGMNLSDGIFTQITFTSPPDPAVALLEPNSQSIFRFGPSSLELQNQVRAGIGKDNPLPKGMPVTAMAFSPNKILFYFVDGQLYYASGVP